MCREQMAMYRREAQSGQFFTMKLFQLDAAKAIYAWPLYATPVRAADAILGAWRSGVRHEIRLANYAIVAVESKSKLKESEVVWFYPRVS